MQLETLQKDMIAAMKARDKARKDSISSLISAVKKVAIDEGCRDDIKEELVDRVILKELKTAKEQKLNTLVFTGFLYEELLKDCSSILRYCDYLIDGPYIRELPSHCKYAGSGNQRYLKLRDGLIESDLTFSTEDSSECERIINSDGIVTTTGFFDIL